MLSTSVVVVALTGAMAVSAPSPRLNWQLDYPTAVARAAQQQKPIAVFIADGAADKVVREGKLTDDATKTLGDKYITVFVNTQTEDGRKLAQSFGMTEGLVVSDRDGVKQALRHAGPIAAADLAQSLEKYADPARVVVSTDVQGVVAAAPVVAAPAPAPAPVYYPAPALSYPTFTAPTCRSCR